MPRSDGSRPMSGSNFNANQTQAMLHQHDSKTQRPAPSPQKQGVPKRSGPAIGRNGVNPFFIT